MKTFETVEKLRKYASENYVENGEVFTCKEQIKTPIKYKIFSTSDAEFHHREKQRFGDWFFKWNSKRVKKILDKIDLNVKDIEIKCYCGRKGIDFGDNRIHCGECDYSSFKELNMPKK